MHNSTAQTPSNPEDHGLGSQLLFLLCHLTDRRPFG